MARILVVRWIITFSAPPEILRHCARCADTRPFASSGAIRLNANGKTLDAWLIYRCRSCDRTWNRAVHERVKVSDLSMAYIEDLQLSNPRLVRTIEQDVRGLRTQGAQTPISVSKSLIAGSLSDWSAARILVEPDGVINARLDQVLATELGLSRSRIAAFGQAGVINVAPASRKGVRVRLTRPVEVKLSGQLVEDERSALTPGLVGG